MKYGRVGYNLLNTTKGKYVNLGDWIQTFVMDKIVKDTFGEIGTVQINKQEISGYKGEKCFIIMAGDYSRWGRNDFQPSGDVIPVYLSYHRTERVSWLRGAAFPVGCRDFATYHVLTKKGIPCFMSGCLTLLLPKREETKEQQDLILVDAPIGIYEQVKNLSSFRNIKVYSHEIESCEDAERLAHNALKIYRDTAKCVITSRLHVAAPCIAMGIPTVLVRDYFDSRYGFINRFIELTKTSDFNKDCLDSVKPVELEDFKKQLHDICSRILIHQVYGKKDKELKTDVETFSNDYLRFDTFTPSMPFKTKAFLKIREVAPSFANFVRYNFLKK